MVMELLCTPVKRKFSTAFEKQIEQERCPSYVVTGLTWKRTEFGFTAEFEFSGRWKIPTPVNVTITGRTFGELKDAIINFVKK